MVRVDLMHFLLLENGDIFGEFIFLIGLQVKKGTDLQLVFINTTWLAKCPSESEGIDAMKAVEVPTLDDDEILLLSREQVLSSSGFNPYQRTGTMDKNPRKYLLVKLLKVLFISSDFKQNIVNAMVENDPVVHDLTVDTEGDDKQNPPEEDAIETPYDHSAVPGSKKRTAENIKKPPARSESKQAKALALLQPFGNFTFDGGSGKVSTRSGTNGSIELGESSTPAAIKTGKKQPKKKTQAKAPKKTSTGGKPKFPKPKAAAPPPSPAAVEDEDEEELKPAKRSRRGGGGGGGGSKTSAATVQFAAAPPPATAAVVQTSVPTEDGIKLQQALDQAEQNQLELEELKRIIANLQREQGAGARKKPKNTPVAAALGGNTVNNAAEIRNHNNNMISSTIVAQSPQFSNSQFAAAADEHGVLLPQPIMQQSMVHNNNQHFLHQPHLGLQQQQQYPSQMMQQYAMQQYPSQMMHQYPSSMMQQYPSPMYPPSSSTMMQQHSMLAQPSQPHSSMMPSYAAHPPMQG